MSKVMVVASLLALAVLWILVGQMGFLSSTETTVARVERLAAHTSSLRDLPEVSRSMLAATANDARRHCERARCAGVLADRYHAAASRLAHRLGLPTEALALRQHASAAVVTGSIGTPVRKDR